MLRDLLDVLGSMGTPDESILDDHLPTIWRGVGGIAEEVKTKRCAFRGDFEPAVDIANPKMA
jgi:hypothetical protein